MKCKANRAQKYIHIKLICFMAKFLHGKAYTIFPELMEVLQAFANAIESAVTVHYHFNLSCIFLSMVTVMNSLVQR